MLAGVLPARNRSCLSSQNKVQLRHTCEQHNDAWDIEKEGLPVKSLEKNECQGAVLKRSIFWLKS